MIPLVGGFYFDYLTILFWFDLFLEGRAEILKTILCIFRGFEDTKRTFRNLLTFRNAWIRRCTKNPVRIITNAKIEKIGFDQRPKSRSCLGANTIYFGHSILFKMMLSTALMLSCFSYIYNIYYMCFIFNVYEKLRYHLDLSFKLGIQIKVKVWLLTY